MTRKEAGTFRAEVSDSRGQDVSTLELLEEGEKNTHPHNTHTLTHIIHTHNTHTLTHIIHTHTQYTHTHSQYTVLQHAEVWNPLLLQHTEVWNPLVLQHAECTA